MTTVNALTAAINATTFQSWSPPSADSASHVASPVCDDAWPREVTPPMTISVSHPVAP